MRYHAKLFVHDFKAFLHDAMARPGTGRIELANNIADALVKKNTAAEAALLQQFVLERGIKYLLHFTPICNLRSILRLGFVPRKFLDMQALKNLFAHYFLIYSDKTANGIVFASLYLGQITKCFFRKGNKCSLIGWC